MYEILKEEDKYHLITASSGSEALEIIDRNEIHIVLLDVLMPEMDGYEVCRRIRKIYSSCPIQIVLISGYDKSSDLDDLLNIGADDFIKKPITHLELQARMKAALIRWRNQLKLINERKFYHSTAGQEKNLNKLIAENLNLRREYDKIRDLNQELEKNNKELQQLASLDPLSGLLNRRTLFERIDVEIERSLRLGLPLTGMMIDIDQFKRINDNFGHPCGDMAIREFGQKLTNSLRKYDYAGRYGGEEFFVILPNTTAEIALMIAERFRKEIEETTLSCSSGSFNITVSIGVGQFKQGESPAKWIDRADNAMYRAKQKGRNQVAAE